jgi:4,5-DOPA dioxygenase extradiol
MLTIISRDENILIIGSGSAVHNLLGWREWGDKPSPDYVIGFDKVMETHALRLTVSLYIYIITNQVLNRTK